MMSFRPDPDVHRVTLDEQRQISASPRLQRWLFDRLNAFVDRRLVNDVERCLPVVGRPPHGLVQLR